MEENTSPVVGGAIEAPKTPEEWRLVAIEYRKQRKFDKAREAYTKAIELDPSSARAYMDRGAFYRRRMNWDEALADLARAIELDPSLAEAYMCRGDVYYRQGNYDSALADLARAIELDPSLAEAYAVQGHIRSLQGSYYTAIADFTRAIELCPGAGQKPREGAYYSRRASLYSEIHDERAIDDLKKVIELDSLSELPRVMLYKAKCSFNRDLDDDEKEDILGIIARRYDPVLEDKNAENRKRISALRDKSGLLRCLKRYDAVLASITRAIELEDRSFHLDSLLLERAHLYSRMKNYDAALADINKVTETESIFFARSDIYKEMGDYEKALSDHSEAMRLVRERDIRDNKPPEQLRDPWLIWERGDIHRHFKEYDKALADFNEAVRLSPTLKNILCRGDVYVQAGYYDKAIADYDKVLAEENDNPMAFYGRANALAGKGDYEKAIADYDEAIQRNPSFVAGCYIGRALARYQQGNDEEFAKDLLTATRLDSRYIDFFFDIVDVSYRESPRLAWAKPLKKTYDAIFAFMEFCRCKKDDDTIVFQYAPQGVLESVRNTRTLRLRPAGYQNDPEEGLILYKRLESILREDRADIAAFLEALELSNPDNVVFIRSLTSTGNSLLMWNSSYGDNGSGVSIGISKRKLNRGTGINQIQGSLDAAGDNDEKKGERKQKKTTLVPLEKTGLYNMLYIGEEDGETEAKAELEKIAGALREFSPEDLRIPVIKQFLSNLFTFAAHLVKDSAYRHEDECRLIYTDTVRRKNPYIKVQDGVYVETEPVLFEDDRDIVYFGPKVSNVTILKFSHTFKLAGLPFEGKIENMLKASGIKFR
jgi:tetratricopeptide (TPR) repeat protein